MRLEETKSNDGKSMNGVLCMHALTVVLGFDDYFIPAPGGAIFSSLCNSIPLFFGCFIFINIEMHIHVIFVYPVNQPIVS